MHTYQISVPDETIHDHMLSIAEHVMESISGIPFRPEIIPRVQNRLNGLPEITFTLFKDGHCSNFHIRNCHRLSEQRILQRVRSCAPFESINATWNELLDVRILFTETEVIVFAQFRERIQTNLESIRPYLELLLSQVSFDLPVFETPHSTAILKIDLSKNGTKLSKPILSANGVLHANKIRLAAVRTLAASPLGPFPAKCEAINFTITATAAGTFVRGFCLLEPVRKPLPRPIRSARLKPT